MEEVKEDEGQGRIVAELGEDDQEKGDKEGYGNQDRLETGEVGQKINESDQD